MQVQVKRAQEEAERLDGYRVLVDRMWPRGVSKDNARLDEWGASWLPVTSCAAGTGTSMRRTRPRATASNPCLISVTVEREVFDGLNLREVSAQECLRYLNALVSRHPYEVEPVTPIREFDLTRFAFVDGLGSHSRAGKAVQPRARRQPHPGARRSNGREAHRRRHEGRYRDALRRLAMVRELDRLETRRGRLAIELGTADAGTVTAEQLADIDAQHASARATLTRGRERVDSARAALRAVEQAARDVRAGDGVPTDAHRDLVCDADGRDLPARAA